MDHYYGLLLYRQSRSQDRGSFFDSRDDCRCQVAWSEIINHRLWHVSWPYSPSNILTVSQFAIMHFRSLCISDTYSLESARAEVDIDSRERTRKSGVPWDAKMEPVTMMTVTRCLERLRNRAKAERDKGCAKGCRKISTGYSYSHSTSEMISYIQVYLDVPPCMESIIKNVNL